jgi:hypothetical protein
MSARELPPARAGLTPSPPARHTPEPWPGQAPDVHDLLRLQRQAGNRAVQRLLRARSRKLQRAMKFELQTRNEIWRNDGTTATKLDRKYGPKDFLVKGTTGVRLESETNGVLEFETEWERKWPKLKEQIEEAVAMTKAINAAADVPGGRKAFPFDVDHLRKGSKRELKRGEWSRKPGFEGSHEKILKPGEKLEVKVNDPTWKAGIQSSESFLLGQYESFLKQHEWPAYADAAIKSAKTVLAAANTAGLAEADVVNLRNFLEIVFNYVKRGQGGPLSATSGAFADVEYLPAKQAFTLMSRTNFASMYKVLLTKEEKALFKKIVSSGAILTEMGLTKKSRVFVKGYGSHARHAGPTVNEWLTGIIGGNDRLSVSSGNDLSAAMGRFDIEKRKGKKDTGLVKFETRNTQMGAFKIADEWKDYALLLFGKANLARPRATGKDETGLEW